MNLNIKYQIRLICCLLAFSTCLSLFGQQPNKKLKNGGKQDNRKQEVSFQTNIPQHDFDIILGRPTDHSITLSALVNCKADAYINLVDPSTNVSKQINFTLEANEPKEVLIDNLKPNKRYYYYFNYKKEGDKDFKKSTKFFIQTQREKNSAFTFTITADSHLDQNTDVQNYTATLTNASADSADFHIELGDTFMTDKYRNNYKDAFAQYLAQRYYFGLICNSSSFFFVLGNHDGESGGRLSGNKENMTVWSNLTRTKYFPNPLPDAFYTGNTKKESNVSFPQNYYSWVWGDAQFIVLDPFWFTPRSGKEEPWDRTLGKQQYQWLKKTLEESKSKFKFVFIHNLVGGLDLNGEARGGVEAAEYYEWGGKNLDGSKGFKDFRSGWEMPIQELLVKHKVSIVFHGHDHLFANQDLDGIKYQCIPQPGAKGYGNTRNAEEYGYQNGQILNGPGYIRVSVSSNSASVEFVETNTKNNSENKRIASSYIINLK